MNENNMELYTDKNPKTTIKGLGFKDKEKAIEEEKNAKLLMGWPKKKK